MQSDEQMPSTERLARALEDTGDPNLMPLIRNARLALYDDDKSSLFGGLNDFLILDRRSVEP